MNSLVSILVPVYNTKAEYIEKCMDSLITQTYQDIEIIIVDDGSEKETAIQCDKIAETDRRIKVFHKPNGGVSSARNMGLEKAVGDYIAFVDSDDWVDRNYIETLLAGFEDPAVDLSICSMVYETEISNIEKSNPEEHFAYIKYSGQDLFEKFLYSTEIGGFLCNKLFKKAFIMQKLDETLHYSEDFVFVARYSINVRSAIFCPAQLYHYRQDESSASNNLTYNDRIYSLLKSYELIREVYERNSPAQVPEIKKNILKIALNLRARYKMCNANNPTQYQTIQSAISTYMRSVLKSEEIGVTEKINIVLTWIFPTVLFRVKSKLLGRKING